jgi:hypothetical protein
MGISVYYNFFSNINVYLFKILNKKHEPVISLSNFLLRNITYYRLSINIACEKLKYFLH